MKFRNGNIVKITGPGYIYSTYADMATIMGLKNFQNGYNQEISGLTGTVVACAFHEYSDNELFGVRLHCNNIEIIMGKSGLELVRKFQLELQFDKKLFEME